MGYRLKNRAVFFAALCAGGFAASTTVRADSNETIIHLKRSIWGCADPKIATQINDEANPEHSNAQWVAQTRRDGDCITISTKSLWAVQGPDFSGLTYLAYRGTDQKSRSFWVPTDAVDFGPEADTQTANTSSTPAYQPSTSAAASPASTSQSEGQSSTGNQGGGAGIFAVGAFMVFVGLWRRSRRRKSKQSKTANPSRPSKKSAPETPKVPAQSKARPSSVPSVSFRIHPTSRTQQPNQQLSDENAIRVTTTVVTVPSSRRAEFVASTAPIRPKEVGWYFPGAPVTILGFKIADGMVYVGHSQPRVNAFDASFIDPNLPVASNSASAGPLGYWPSYSEISPDCRRRYLEWLAQGKQDPSAELGYVFIYFYGLERRLILENPEVGEARALIAEIERLRTIYTSSASFNGYSARLIEAGALLYNRDSVHAASTAASIERLGEASPMFQMVLAREVASRRPLGFELAVVALCSLSEFWFPHKNVIQRSRAVFLQVFRGRFQSRFPLGFAAKPHSGSRLSIPYRGASAGLSVDLAARAGLGDLPDPTSSAWGELVAIGVEVAGLVASFSNSVLRHPGWQNSLAALIDCPPELKAIVATDGRKWADGLPALGAFKFGEVAKHAIGMEHPKWTVKHRREICAALATVGYAMEPGPDEREQLEDATIVQVFRHSGSAMSRNAEVARAAAMMVAAIAKIAANAADRIEGFWISQIPSRLWLTPDETTHLRARLAWLRGKPISLAKTKRLLEDATSDENAFCAWSATVAVGASGTPEKSRVALLEAMHDALGVPRAKLYAALHAGIATATDAASEPIIVSEAIAEPPHAIPQPPSAASTQTPPAPISYEFAGEPLPLEVEAAPEHQDAQPQLAPAPIAAPGPAGVDLEKLAKIRAETERTAALLAEVFVDDEEPEDTAAQIGDGPFPGLDEEHTAFLNQLLSRGEWPRDEFDQAASSAGLMPDGAMEAINEWAFDHLDSPLLDDGDSVVVHRDLLATNAEAAAAD